MNAVDKLAADAESAAAKNLAEAKAAVERDVARTEAFIRSLMADQIKDPVFVRSCAETREMMGIPDNMEPSEYLPAMSAASAFSCAAQAFAKIVAELASAGSPIPIDDVIDVASRVAHIAVGRFVHETSKKAAH